MLAKKRTSRKTSRCILSGIASPHIYLNAVQTCGISRGVRAQEFKDKRDLYACKYRDIGKIISPLDSLQIKGGDND